METKKKVIGAKVSEKVYCQIQMASNGKMSDWVRDAINEKLNGGTTEKKTSKLRCLFGRIVGIKQRECK